MLCHVGGTVVTTALCAMSCRWHCCYHSVMCYAMWVALLLPLATVTQEIMAPTQHPWDVPQAVSLTMQAVIN